jgi:ribosome-associated toxin RatA of RatAB toxin-antitoxin module
MNRRRLLVVAMCAPMLAGRAAPAAAVDVQVSVARRGQMLVVDALLVAPVPAREAWDVLTDFDAMGGFVPNLEASRVTAREGNRLRVEQRGVARWGPLAHAFTTVREVELEPIERVRSRSIGGSLHPLASDTRFAAVAGGTEVRHHLEFDVDSWMPAALIEPFLRHEVREQFEAVVAEMLRRRASR